MMEVDWRGCAVHLHYLGKSTMRIRRAFGATAWAATLAGALFVGGCGSHGGTAMPMPGNPAPGQAGAHRMAGVPVHILTWDDLTTGSVSLPQASPWLTWALVDPSSSAQARALGIKTAIYTDPARQRPGGFAWTDDEATFAHDCSGNRIAVQPNPLPGTMLMNPHSQHLKQ